jgi:hypothetical protein
MVAPRPSTSRAQKEQHPRCAQGPSCPLTLLQCAFDWDQAVAHCSSTAAHPIGPGRPRPHLTNTPKTQLSSCQCCCCQLVICSLYCCCCT